MKPKAQLAFLTFATHLAAVRFARASPGQNLLAYSIPHAPAVALWYPGTDVETIYTVSETFCAIQCYFRFCVGYRYLEHECFLEGLGAHSNTARSGPHLYRRAFTNAAFQRPAFGINNYPQSPPANAVDDISCLEWSSGNQECCFGTYSILLPWLLVDLERPKKLLLVDVASDTLKKFEIRVGQEMRTDGNFSTYDLFGNTPSGSSRGRAVFTQPEGVVGRFLSIQMFSETNMRVCDLVVLAEDLN